MCFCAVIGKRFRDAGLLDILVESHVVASGSINAVFDGRHYNRALMAHKVVHEALERLRFRAFLIHVGDKRKDIETMLRQAIEFPANAFHNLVSGQDMSELFAEYQQFISAKGEENKTFGFWNSYLEMVHLLLAYIRAIRTSDWDAHLKSVGQLLPWVTAYDRTFYARYLPIYS